MAEEETQKQKFPNGSWVKGINAEGDRFDYGVVTGFDNEDGQHMVQTFTAKIEHQDRGGSGCHWCDADDLDAIDSGPPWLSVKPGHALACDWEFDGETQIALMAEPQEVLDRFGDGLSESERKNFQLKLMECVAAGGERVELPGQQSVGVRFLVVGDE